ncbi:glycosyltransferase family 4 protein [Sphingomonas koreensis]
MLPRREDISRSHADELQSAFVPGGVDHARKLRVALFSGNYNCVVDGANRMLNRLIAYGMEQGLDARIYSPATANPAFPPEGELIPVRSFPIPRRPEYRFAPHLPRKVASDVRKFGPDLFHVSCPDGLGDGAIRLARGMNVPVVASLHTRFETYFEFYRLGFLRRPAEAWLRSFYNRCDLLLVPSNILAQEMRRLGVSTPMRVWTGGVDSQQFHPSRRDIAWRRTCGIEDHEIAILFFGRLVLEKGLAMFETVVRQLHKEGIAVRPLVVGDGPERDRFARRLKDGVFTGHLAGDELARVVASADLFLNPSITESFGIVTLEAMASGVATIAANVPANCLLLQNGRAGRLVDPSSVDDYVQAVRGLIMAPSARQILADAGTLAAQDFSWPFTLKAVLEAYGDLAGDCPASPG